MHGAFKTGTDKSDWTAKKLLCSCWKIFRKSPTRRDDFKTITGTTVFNQIVITGYFEPYLCLYQFGRPICHSCAMMYTK